MSIYMHKTMTIAKIIKRWVTPQQIAEHTREFTFDRLGLLEALLVDDVTQNTSSSPRTK